MSVIPGLEQEASRFLLENASPVSAKAGTRLFEAGQACSHLVLLEKGSVRVQMVSESGRQITLYRVAHGQTCIMTVACLINESHFRAEGIAETDITGLAINQATFQALLAQSDIFRTQVLGAYTSRVLDLISLFEDVTFRSMEDRLIERLRILADAKGIIVNTHQDLALDLGTAREVISRHLKKMEGKGLVKLRRGIIELLP